MMYRTRSDLGVRGFTVLCPEKVGNGNSASPPHAGSMQVDSGTRAGRARQPTSSSVQLPTLCSLAIGRVGFDGYFL